MNECSPLGTEQQHMSLGYDYLAKERWPEAREEFEKVIQINPGNIWVHIELSKVYRNERRFDIAEKKLRDVLSMPLNNEQTERLHMSLGEIYLLQGRHGQAIEQYKEALNINPDNKRLRKWLERNDQVCSFRKGIAPYRVLFTWGMHYQCNYRCAYCNAPKPEKPDFNEKEQNRVLYLGVEEWVQAWGNIYKKYGRCRIRLDGGEPSVYPSFIDLVAKVSRQHLLQINTNLSFNIESFIKVVRPDMVRIDASFHPEYTTLEDFLHKILTLNENGFKVVVSVVAYPPFLDKIKGYKQPFESRRIPFLIHPFSGEFNGKSYPCAYEMCEISKIYSVDEASKLIMGWRKGEKNITKGKLCRMGQIYGRIYPSGDVYRCCAEGGMLKIGNILDHAFQLLDDALECGSESCPCWKCMIVCEEERWTPLWLDEWELP